MKTKIDITYVAKLAKIKLNKKEKETLSAELYTILNFINKLNEIDTSLTPPTSHPFSIKNVFRKDVAHPSLPIAKVRRLTPQMKNDFFKVPKIIEK